MSDFGRRFRALDESAQNTLLREIATWYYSGETTRQTSQGTRRLTQQEIAEKFGTSRFLVGRLLKMAHERQLVEVRVRMWGREEGWEARIREMFGNNLEDVIVVGRDPDHRSVEAVSRESGHYLMEALSQIRKQACVVGVSWGAHLREVGRFLMRCPRMVFPFEVLHMLPLTGITDPEHPEDTANVIARKMARALVNREDRAEWLAAPAFVHTVEEQKAVAKKHPQIFDFLERRQLDLAIVGLGYIGENAPLVKMGWASQKDLEVMKGQGAVGELQGQFFTLEGGLINDPRSLQIIGASLQDFRELPKVVCVTTGRERGAAIVGAIRGGYIKVLITDVSTAEAVETAANRRG
jgi:DNA-binding transcriptional regulator LsrR (DeoR family)